MCGVGFGAGQRDFGQFDVLVAHLVLCEVVEDVGDFGELEFFVECVDFGDDGVEPREDLGVCVCYVDWYFAGDGCFVQQCEVGGVSEFVAEVVGIDYLFFVDGLVGVWVGVLQQRQVYCVGAVGVHL